MKPKTISVPFQVKVEPDSWRRTIRQLRAIRDAIDEFAAALERAYDDDQVEAVTQEQAEKKG